MNIEVTFKAQTQNDLEQQIAALLRRCGWQCSKGDPWQRPKEVANEFKIQSNVLTQRLQRYIERGGSFPAKRGPTGRILKLQVVPELRAYFEGLRG